jgi:hypothetical protein
VVLVVVVVVVVAGAGDLPRRLPLLCGGKVEEAWRMCLHCGHSSCLASEEEGAEEVKELSPPSLLPATPSGLASSPSEEAADKDKDAAPHPHRAHVPGSASASASLLLPSLLDLVGWVSVSVSVWVCVSVLPSTT